MRGSMLMLCLLALVAQASRAGEKLVPGSADGVTPLAIGARAPQVTLRTIDGAPFALGPAIAKHPVVLIFYRGGW